MFSISFTGSSTANGPAFADEKIAAKTALTELVQEISSTPDTQLLVFAMVSPKADIGFMLLTPDLQTANAFEKRLALSLGPDVLSPVYSFFSLTEQSEYTTSDEEVRRDPGRRGQARARHPGLPGKDGRVFQADGGSTRRTSSTRCFRSGRSFAFTR